MEGVGDEAKVGLEPYRALVGEVSRTKLVGRMLTGNVGSCLLG